MTCFNYANRLFLIAILLSELLLTSNWYVTELTLKKKNGMTIDDMQSLISAVLCDILGIQIYLHASDDNNISIIFRYDFIGHVIYILT